MMVLALLLLGHGVQAAETVILTLSCDGTATNMMSNSDNKPEPITKMGLLVNFPERTVTGFTYPAHFDDKWSDAVRLAFSGKNGNWSVNGTIEAECKARPRNHHCFLHVLMLHKLPSQVR
jgi:hypothetical protein